jgi:23S rRNA (adenine2503-C2)-methyltransferase
MARKNLIGLSAFEISALIGPAGFNALHAASIAHSIYKKRITDIGLINKVPGKLKDLLNENFCTGLFPPVGSELSADGTIKYLFRASDGKLFESVFIPDNKRNTVCASTQSGCRMGCSFCATAGYGFHGDLSAGEIVNQIISIPGADKVTHVVLMGMGEPMDNIDNVLKACHILTSEWGLSLSPRNVTVSTVGITPGIVKFLADSRCNLALSLFSPFEEERKTLVPAEIKYPVKSIMKLLKDYPVRKSRRLSLAYVMIQGLNDTDRHLNELKALIGDSGLRVNLIPFHPTGKDSFISSSPERMLYFKHNLVVSGISASIRKSRGVDISAACGLLASSLRSSLF